MLCQLSHVPSHCVWSHCYLRYLNFRPSAACRRWRLSARKFLRNRCISGMKFTNSADRLFQIFITKCMDRSSIVLIDHSFYDTSFLIIMVQHQHLATMILLWLMPSSLYPTEPSTKRKYSRTTEECHVANSSKFLEHIFPEGHRIEEVFSREVAHCMPTFNGDIKSRICFYSNYFYFKNCSHKNLLHYLTSSRFWKKLWVTAAASQILRSRGVSRKHSHSTLSQKFDYF